LPGDSPPAYFFLVCNKIMLENPHIFLVKTGSKSRQPGKMIRLSAFLFMTKRKGLLRCGSSPFPL
ncbi:hypothetical protein, partial [uncultured Ruminococcus sp.]|uniref:hypothetical protein n=1 Tax=uncultured Ruminococcus sp. TaxID=165186 RepID=UPI0027DB5746